MFSVQFKYNFFSHQWWSDLFFMRFTSLLIYLLLFIILEHSPLLYVHMAFGEIDFICAASGDDLGMLCLSLAGFLVLTQCYFQ